MAARALYIDLLAAKCTVLNLVPWIYLGTAVLGTAVYTVVQLYPVVACNNNRSKFSTKFSVIDTKFSNMLGESKSGCGPGVLGHLAHMWQDCMLQDAPVVITKSRMPGL